jgi:hypothetical protein
MEDVVVVKKYNNGDDSLFIACVYFFSEYLLSNSVDGHDSREAAEFARDKLVPAIVAKLFENPDAIADEITKIFHEVDAEYCNGKAKKMNEIILKQNRCCKPKVNSKPRNVWFYIFY